VHLKSGAYLVIQPTEALTVIDVNSGKCIKGTQKDFYLKINLEAAKEIARQLRLRNISGICLVDFINMDTKEAREELIEALKQHLAKDIVPAVFIDFTELGLAEITRKKVRKPLWEQLPG
jgi:ribonuclease G